MKLINHVLKIRSLVQQSIDNRFSKMGLKEDGVIAIDQLPESLIEKRGKLEDILNNHLEELKDYAKARQETINECTFTLFNRIAAIKVMEDKELFPEVIRRRPENGNKSFAHNLWLEEHPEEKSSERQGLKHFLQDKFNELGEHFPLYNEKYPYAIMPTADELYNILEAFNEVENDPDCGADIWEGDDILGWLYENFNATEKEMLKESGEKTEYDKVSLQSQVYTPQWVVKFLVDNTLGKLYLEMFPDSDLVRPDENGTVKYQIANAPKTRTREPKKMEELRVIDPACGSGNFLIYTFSLLYDMYVNQVEQYGADYSKRDIPKLIIENNIYGVDLDERAVQLSQIALYVKAREIGGRRAQVPQHTNVVSTHFFLPDFEEVASAFDSDGEWDSKQMEIIRKIWADLQNAYKFGTLVRIEEVLNSLTPNDASDSLFADQEADNLFSFKRRVTDILREQVSKYCSENSTEYALTKANDAMAFLGILSMPFDVAVANPPYTDSGDFGVELKKYIDTNYSRPQRFNTNLYSSFILRCSELAGHSGKIGIIHPNTFMFLKTFEDVREYLVNKTHINVFVDYGLDRVNLFGPGVLLEAAFYTLDKGEDNNNIGVYFNITEGQQEKFKKGSLDKCIHDLANCIKNDRVFLLSQCAFKGIESMPFTYWISDNFREKFRGEKLSDTFDICNGISSGGNNEQFYRYHWEVEKNNILNSCNGDSYEWTFINKGGPFNKWYGNNWLVFYWKNNGQKLKSMKKQYPSIRYGFENHYFKEGLAFAGVGKSLSVRLQPEYFIFERAGKSVFTKEDKPAQNYYSVLAYLNSTLCSYLMKCLNRTVSFQSGDLERLPYVSCNDATLIELSKQNVEIKKDLCSFSIIEPSFNKTAIQPCNDISDGLFNYYALESSLLSLIMINEGVIDNIIYNTYGLTDNELYDVYKKEGIHISKHPVSSEAKTAFIDWLNSESSYSLSSSVLQYISNLPEDSNIEMISDFDELYQNNNWWEDFCNKHAMNPIEVLYQFKRSHVIPQQRSRDLCFELITDVIRTVLGKDDDGVIPLIDRMGEERLSMRIEQEMIERGFSASNITQLTTLLGNSLDSYLKDSFFSQLSDYLNLFMFFPKTPFIWHITSGQHHAIELYASFYKWNRNTLFRIKSVYAANIEASIKDRISSLDENDTLSTMEINELNLKLEEIKIFVNKLDKLLSSGYDPKINAGVGANIAPLQKLGLLHNNILKDTQLKKYMKADWGDMS